MTAVLKTGQFYGNILQKSVWSGICLSEIAHAKGRKLPSHTHESAFFCLLLRGSYSEQAGGRRMDYGPFTVGYHPPGTRHSDEIGQSGAHFFSIEVAEKWLAHAREYAPSFNPTTQLCGGEIVWLAMKLHRKHRAKEVSSPLTIEGIVLEMLAETAKPRHVEEHGRPRWLARAMDFLQSRFSENLTLEQVAVEVGVHPVHLSRVFRKTYHTTLGEYLNGLRVEFAFEQLKNPEVDLSELALAAGFADQSHFTRVFKRITGNTPGAFRAFNRPH